MGSRSSFRLLHRYWTLGLHASKLGANRWLHPIQQWRTLNVDAFDYSNPLPSAVPVSQQYWFWDDNPEIYNAIYTKYSVFLCPSDNAEGYIKNNGAGTTGVLFAPHRNGTGLSTWLATDIPPDPVGIRMGLTNYLGSMGRLPGNGAEWAAAAGNPAFGPLIDNYKGIFRYKSKTRMGHTSRTELPRLSCSAKYRRLG